MAVTGLVHAYDRAVELLTNYPDLYDFAEGQVRVSLHSSAYHPSASHAYSGDLLGEVAGKNYQKKALSGRSVRYDTATHRFQFGATRVTWPLSTITARYAVVSFIQQLEAPNLMCWVDFGQDLRSTNSTFVLSWESGIIMELEGAVS